MAFFQPKKEHKDKPFLFQINTHLSECGTEPGYENRGTIYLLDVTYKGTAEYVAFTFDDGKPFTFTNGNKVTLKASEALYKKMSEASGKKDDHVEIMLTDWTDPKGTKKTVWNVVIHDAATVPKVVNNVQNGSKSVNIPISSGTLGITWGMCINNATKLVIARGIPKDIGLGAEIESVAKELMDVAVDGLEKWQYEHYQKDQNSEPNGDDLPF